MGARLKRIWIILLEELALFTSEIFIVTVAGILAVFAFVKMALMLSNNAVKDFDNRLWNIVQSYQSETNTSIMKFVTFFGNPQGAVIPGAILLIYFLFIKPHRWYSILVPAVGVGSFFINRLMKSIFNRPRPILEERMVEVIYNLSFPSGHAMFAVAFYGLFIYISWHYLKSNWLKVICTLLILVFIFLIGVSRVYLKVHYPSDIIAGFAAGFIWLITAIYSAKAIEKIIKNREQRKAKVKPE